MKVFVLCVDLCWMVGKRLILTQAKMSKIDEVQKDYAEKLPLYVHSTILQRNLLLLHCCRAIVESQLSLLIKIQRDSVLEGKKISLG